MKKLFGTIVLGGLFSLLFLAPLTASAQGCQWDAHCWAAGPCQVGVCQFHLSAGTCAYPYVAEGTSCSLDGDPTTIEQCTVSGSCIFVCDDLDEDGYCDDTEDICPPPADDDVGCAGSGGPETVEINRYNLPVDWEDTYSFSVAEGTLVSVYLEAFYSNALLETRWVHGGPVICTRNVGAGQTWGCDGGEMFVPAGTNTVYVTVTGTGPDTTNYTLTVDHTTPAGGWICRDYDYDGICNADDPCPWQSDFIDSDGDGTSDCLDGCAFNPTRTEPGICGCSVPAVEDTTDSDGDGVVDCLDACPGFDDNNDLDSDGTPDGCDGCPNDSAKAEPGVCGCGESDVDTDGDGTPDCVDGCPNYYYKTEPGICGCGVMDSDWDGDGVLNCLDGCWQDANKTDPGVCGCGEVEDPTDADADGVWDCVDPCIGSEEYCSCEGAPAWLDETTGLTWEGEAQSSNYAEGVAHCENLVLDGADDWRLPTIDELRTLVVGCDELAPGGDCHVSDPTCLDSTNPECTDSCFIQYEGFPFPIATPVCAPRESAYMSECVAAGSTLLFSSSEVDALPGNYWGMNFAGGELVTFSGSFGLDFRCVRDACTDTDGDGVCDAEDICPGFDDTIDTDGDGTPDGCDICEGGYDHWDDYGHGPQNLSAFSEPNEFPDYCDCLNFDVTGTLLTNPISLEPDGIVTNDLANPAWWLDDTMACYHTLVTPAYLFYFPRCDVDGDGAVTVQEIYDIYHFANISPPGIPCDAAFGI